MPLLLRSGLRYYLHHKWQGLLALIGVALGVAIVLAVDLASSSASRAFHNSAEQIRGKATHRIIGAANSINEQHYLDLVTETRGISIAPVITEWIQLDLNQGKEPRGYQILGVDPLAEAPFRTLENGTPVINNLDPKWFTLPGSIIIPEAIANRYRIKQGAKIVSRFQNTTSQLTVVGLHRLPSEIILTDISSAQEITNQLGKLSHIDVIAGDGQLESLKALVPTSLRLIETQKQLQGISQLSDAFQLNLTALSLLAMLVGMFLIFNAISFSFVQRRILIGRLRAIGVTETELFKWFLLEAGVLAVLGCLIGAAIGIWLGTHLTHLVAGTINELYYRVSVDSVDLQWSTLAKACMLGILGTLISAAIPARQAAKSPPISALSRAFVEHRTVSRLPHLSVIGFTCLLLASALPMWDSTGLIGGFLSIFLTVLGAAFLIPPVFHLCYLLLRKSPTPLLASMAIRDMDRHLSRLSIAGAALMVALSAGLGIGIMVESMRGAVTNWLEELLNADLYVAHALLDEGVYLEPKIVEQIVTLPAVSDYSLYRHRQIDLDSRPVTLVAARLANQSRVGFSLISPDPKTIWKSYDQGAVIITETLAYHFRLQAGDLISLPTDRGAKQFPIAAIFRDFASEHGRIFLDLKTYQAQWDDNQVGSVGLFGRPGADIQILSNAITELNTDTNQLSINQGRGILDESLAIFDRTFRITEVLHVLSLGIAFIGVLSAIMALQLERAKEYATLRALGFTPIQIVSLIVLGSMIIGALAALASLPTGLLMAWTLVDTVQLRAFGWSLPFEPKTSLLIQPLYLGLLAAGAASVYPAWRSARTNPATSLREE